MSKYLSSVTIFNARTSRRRRSLVVTFVEDAKLTRELRSNATILDCAKNTSFSTLQNVLKARSSGIRDMLSQTVYYRKLSRRTLNLTLIRRIQIIQYFMRKKFTVIAWIEQTYTLSRLTWMQASVLVSLVCLLTCRLRFRWDSLITFTSS